MPRNNREMGRINREKPNSLENQSRNGRIDREIERIEAENPALRTDIGCCRVDAVSSRINRETRSPLPFTGAGPCTIEAEIDPNPYKNGPGLPADRQRIRAVHYSL
ncbi:hypothetical protein [Salibacterium lacus]|uniref:Uncharacterized protein n=1 Tax=Salibacterium lacus TaxID=1898109 RepID=A0ABW5T6N9_9BACI